MNLYNKYGILLLKQIEYCWTFAKNIFFHFYICFFTTRIQQLLMCYKGEQTIPQFYSTLLKTLFSWDNFLRVLVLNSYLLVILALMYGSVILKQFYLILIELNWSPYPSTQQVGPPPPPLCNHPVTTSISRLTNSPKISGPLKYTRAVVCFN